MLSPKTPAPLVALDKVDDQADLTYKGESGRDNDRHSLTVPRKPSKMWTTLGPLVWDLVVRRQMDDLLARPPPEDIDVPLLLEKHEIYRPFRGLLWLNVLHDLTNKGSLFWETVEWYFSNREPERKSTPCLFRACSADRSIKLRHHTIGPYFDCRDPVWRSHTLGTIEVDLSSMCCSNCGHVGDRNEHEADMKAISRLRSTSDDRYWPYRISVVPYNDDSFRLRLIFYEKNTSEGRVVGKSKRYDLRSGVGLVVLQQVIIDAHNLFFNKRPIECMALYDPSLI